MITFTADIMLAIDEHRFNDARTLLGAYHPNATPKAINSALASAISLRHPDLEGSR